MTSISYDKFALGLIYTPNIVCRDIEDYLKMAQAYPKKFKQACFGIMCSPCYVRYIIKNLRIESKAVRDYCMTYTLLTPAIEYLPPYHPKSIKTQIVRFNLTDSHNRLTAEFIPTDKNLDGADAFEVENGDIVDIKIIGRSDPIVLEKVIKSNRKT